MITNWVADQIQQRITPGTAAAAESFCWFLVAVVAVDHGLQAALFLFF